MRSDNGCLELLMSERIRDLLPAEKDLTLSEDFEMKNEWISVETEPGDILVLTPISRTSQQLI